MKTVNGKRLTTEGTRLAIKRWAKKAKTKGFMSGYSMRVGSAVKLAFHLLVFAVLVSGCAPPVISVPEHQRAYFSKNATVTVTMDKPFHDPLGFQGEFEHHLLAKGYNVVSEAVAVRKAKFDTNMDYNNNRAQGGSESYNVRELMSVYLLTLKYDYDFYGGLHLKNCTVHS